MAQTVAWVEALDAQSGEVKRFTNAECRFGYRESRFTNSALIILRAAFKLSSMPKPDLSYKDLAVAFAGKSPGLPDIRAAVLAIRAGKFPDLSREGTAGSFFKNPVLPEREAQALQKRFPGLPLFPMPEVPGHMKVPLAWLLDHVLNMRGERAGGARLFEKQLLVVAASREASARDVRALAECVQKKVKEEIGINITPEVKIILK